MPTHWLHWSELPWIAGPDAAARVVPLCERLLEAAVQSSTVAEYVQRQLPEIAAEFPAQWVGVLQRTPSWEFVAQYGRQTLPELPFRFFEDVLDRDAAGSHSVDAPGGWTVLAVPVGTRESPGTVLALAGRAVPEDALPVLLAVGRAFGLAMEIARRQERGTRRIARLQSTLQIATAFADTHETEPLLELIAREATRLLDCDRASIFIWDPERHEVVACPALGVTGGSLRLPDRLGIVGQVIHTGETIFVDDAYSDPRFNQEVDRASGYRTRNLLCAPLLDGAERLIGAFEVINKQTGTFSQEDAESLGELGMQAAIALQNTREREVLVRTQQQLTEQVTQGAQIIGESAAVSALRGTIQRLAATDLPVLVLGESGTGKEVVSQALHFQGPRAAHPFVAVNCAALTETLLESELFGHEKGAFTDAHDTRRGKFELADGGTLFLDEIGDMSLGGQAKLLRVLEQKVITRVGGSQSIPINVRVIAATNTVLANAVRERRFREDLFYRLSVVTLELPPLRERPEDILPLAEFFLDKFSLQARRKKMYLSADAKRRMQAHGWPGNVRELRNLMERVAFLAPKERVEADDLAFILTPEREGSFDLSPDAGLSEATARFQQEHIRRAVKRVRGNMSEAARLLGLHRSNLYRKMRQLGMSEAEGESDGEP